MERRTSPPPLARSARAFGWLAASVLLLGATRLEAGPWDLPVPGECAAARAMPAKDAGDPAPFPIAPGDVVTFDALDRLEPFLPPAAWEQRAKLFSPGMRLEVGPCFRSYAPPQFFRDATERFAGQAHLVEGGLEGTPAGLPFPPEAIAADDPEAGRKWAWNAARRYQGAGRFGDIRVTRLAGGSPTASLVGDTFLAILVGRADLPDAGFRVPWAKKERWVAGGKVRDPGTGGTCAFRQYRGVEAERDGDASDDVFFRSSAMRRAERVGWDPEFPMTACSYERGHYLARGAKVARYRWKVAGVRDLLAPVNARTPSYPADDARRFGDSGGSLADDRWELRRVLVLEATAEGVVIRRYLDLETLFPLYHVEEWGRARILVQHAGRFSEDRPGYPRWPDDASRPVRILDPVVTVLWNGDETTRYEAWEAVAVPPERPPLRRRVSVGTLDRE